MNKKILIVEDEAPTALHESKLLKNHGYTPVVAYSGEQAVELMNNDHEISLVLMDVELGAGIDGTETARQILELHTVPIVFISNHTEKKYIDRIKSITRYGFVYKNAGDVVLIESVRMAFELFESHLQLSESGKTYKALFDNNSSPILLIRPQTGEIVDANPAACSFYGWPKGRLIKMKIQEINQLPEEIVYREMKKAQGQVRNHFHFTHKIADGSEREVEVCSSKLDIQGEQLLYSIITDVTEQKRAERKAIENAEKYRTLFEESPLGIFRSTPEGRFLEVNPTLASMLGYPSPESVLENIYSIAEQIYVNSEERQPIVNEQWPSDKMHHYYNRYQRRDGSEFVANLYLNTIHDENNQPLYFEGIVEDITDRIEAEKQLRYHQSQIESLFRYSTVAIVMMDLQNHVLNANHAFQELFGFSLKELQGKVLEDLICPDRFYDDESKELDKQSLDGIQGVDLIRTRKDGTEIDVRVSAGPLKMDNTYIGRFAIFEDITLKKRSEEKLEKALQTQEFLMRELNHRVKNNLLMISSLISLKNNEIGDQVDLSGLVRQINAIRIVHEKLMQSEKITHIALREYIEDLLYSIFSSFSIQHVKVNIEIEDFSLRTKHAIPIGLIINEIATNAIKHGFTPEVDAEFSVRMTLDQENTQYVLQIANTGNPFPDDISIDNPPSLGLRLINALTTQIDGVIDLEKRPHPCFTIRFPVEPSELNTKPSEKHSGP